MSERDCPICLESTEDLIVLCCTHVIHEDCAKGLIDYRCPVCRGVVTWPEHIKKDIKENIGRRTECLVEEEEMSLRGEYIEMARSNDNFLIDLLDEFLLAINYLEGLNVSRRFIPDDVIISSQFPPEMGFVFANVVIRAAANMSAEIDSSDGEYSSDEENSSDDEE